MWSRDGRELFYRVGRRPMVVPIAAGDTFQAGEPRTLFELPGDRYDVAHDGQHFVCTQAPPREPATSLRVIVGWRPTPLK